MYKYIYFLTCGIMIAASHVAMAAEGPTGACKLITQSDIAELHLNIEGEPREEGVNVPKGVSGAPTEIWSSICTINFGKKGAQFMSVAIHNFSTPVTIEELDAWEDEKGGFDDIAKSRTGEITCEAGQYDYLSAKDGKPAVVQYYEACDQLMGGKQRLVVNLQMDDKTLLPPIEKVRALLEVALKHMGPQLEAIPAKARVGTPMPAA